MDYDIAHINISVKSEKEANKELATVERERRSFEEGTSRCPFEDDKPVVGWHTDSFPFVCVVMLSDCTNMVGGETALRTADGDVRKVRGPEMVRSNSIYPESSDARGGCCAIRSNSTQKKSKLTN